MSSWVSCIKKVEWGDFCLRNGIKWDNDSSEITLHCCQNMFCLMLKVGVDIKNVQRKILMFVKPKPINLARSPLPMPYCNVCKKNHLSNAFSVGWLFDSTCIWQKKTWNFPCLFGGSLHGIWWYPSHHLMLPVYRKIWYVHNASAFLQIALFFPKTVQQPILVGAFNRCWKIGSSNSIIYPGRDEHLKKDIWNHHPAFNKQSVQSWGLCIQKHQLGTSQWYPREALPQDCLTR